MAGGGWPAGDGSAGDKDEWRGHRGATCERDGLEAPRWWARF